MSEVTTKPQSEVQTEVSRVLEQMKNKLTEKWKEVDNGFESTLSTGEIVLIEKGKGKHLKLARRLMDGNPELYGVAMQSLLVKVNGKNMVMEQFEEWFDNLPLKDAQSLTGKFSEENF